MKYISIDTETTGTDKEKCQIIEIGAIIEDTSNILSYEEIPKFECIVEWPEYTGSAFAINMNNRIFNILAGIETTKERSAYKQWHNIIPQYEVAEKFFWWLFDNDFAEMRTKWTDEKFLDSHPSLRNEFKKYQENPIKNIKEIEKYYEVPIVITVAGKNFARFDWDFFLKLSRWNPLIKFSQRVMDPAILCVDWKNDFRLPNSNECKERSNLGNIVSHKAIEDAWDVIQILRKQTNNYTT